MINNYHGANFIITKCPEGHYHVHNGFVEICRADSLHYALNILQSANLVIWIKLEMSNMKCVLSNVKIGIFDSFEIPNNAWLN